VRITDGCNFENLGQTYWVRVWENGNDNNGAYSICAYGDEASSAVNPTGCEGNLLAGNACCEAILMSSDELDGYCGNTGGYNAQPSSVIDEFCANIENNAWIAFVPSDNLVGTQLQALAIGYGPYSYSWSPTTGLDDPTSPNPIASPTSTTNYTVTITGGTQPITGAVEITVIEAPTTANITGHNSVCENSMDEIYQVNSPNATTFNWVLTSGDGTITSATDENEVRIDWGTSGGQLCVTVANDHCPGLQDCITVTTSPNTEVTAMDPAVSCAPEVVNLTSIPINISGAVGVVSYHPTQAAADDGWPIINPPLVDTTGTYYIRVQTSVNCYDVTSVFVDIEYVDVEVRNPPPVCQPTMIDLDAQVSINEMGWGPGTKAFYFFANLGILPLTNTVVSTPGDYFLRAESPGGCEQIVTITITATNNPVGEIDGNGPVCPGEQASLFFDLNGVGPFDVVFTDGTTNTTLTGIMDGATEMVTVNSNTTYSIVSLTDVTGCPGDIVGNPVEIQVHSVPTATISGDNSVCGNTAVDLTFNFTGTGPYDVVYSDGTNDFTLTGKWYLDGKYFYQ